MALSGSLCRWGMAEARPRKFVLLGEPGVGKSWLNSRFVKDVCEQNCTSSRECLEITVRVRERLVLLHLFEHVEPPPTHCSYPTLRRVDVEGIVVSAASLTPLQDYDGWVAFCDRYGPDAYDPNARPFVRVYVLNKVDLCSAVEVEALLSRFREERGVAFCPVSAKTGMGVDLFFMTAAGLSEQQEIDIEAAKPASVPAPARVDRLRPGGREPSILRRIIYHNFQSPTYSLPARWKRT